MAPLSKNNEMCSEIDTSSICEKLEQIQLDKSTYDIDDNEDENDDKTKSDEENLDDCVTIKEKGPILAYNNNNNNRFLPYERPPAEINLNYFHDLREPLNFNHPDFNVLFFNNIENIPDDIPEPVLDLIVQPQPTIQRHDAEKQLSEFIDGNLKLKQDIWILVNIKHEQELLKKLKNQIRSQHFNHIDLNYIYAIIIRLMKDDGKQMLLDYLATENVLLKIALKQNQLLLNFILEIYSNNLIYGQENILHEIIKHQQMELGDVFETLINFKFTDNNYMFDVNWTDVNGETILMLLVKYIGNDKTKQVNYKYLDLILNRYPNINYTTIDGKNIFHFAYTWNCDQLTIHRIQSHYDVSIVNNLMSQMDVNGYRPFDIQTIYY